MKMWYLKMKQWLFLFVLLGAINNHLIGHGVAGHTQIRMLFKPMSQQACFETWMGIAHLQVRTHGQKVWVKTWHQQQNFYQFKPIQVTSAGSTNCYMQLTLTSQHDGILSCAPDQLFYILLAAGEKDQIKQPTKDQGYYVKYMDHPGVTKRGCWAQACTMQAGQILLRENWDGLGQGLVIQEVHFKSQPLEVYNLDVEGNHTYLVTHYNLVTHNSNLSPVLHFSNVAHGCQFAAATGIAAGIASWLSGFGIDMSVKGLVLAFSTPIGTPVLVAASAASVGFIAWQAFSVFGQKHVAQSMRFNVPQINQFRKDLNPPNITCGTAQLPHTHTPKSTCEIKTPKRQDLPKETCLPVQTFTPITDCGSRIAEVEPNTSCPTSQQAGIAGELTADQPSNAETTEIKAENHEAIIAAEPENNAEPENAESKNEVIEVGVSDEVLIAEAEDGASSPEEAIPVIILDDKVQAESDSKNSRAVIDKIIQEILSDSKPGEKTTGQTTQYEKLAGWTEAKIDFYKFNPSNIRHLSEIKTANNADGSLKQITEEMFIGILSDGRKINIRTKSSDKRPTLEIQDGKKKTKIRYGVK
jgi:hypothetical protein